MPEPLDEQMTERLLGGLSRCLGAAPENVGRDVESLYHFDGSASVVARVRTPEGRFIVKHTRADGDVWRHDEIGLRFVQEVAGSPPLAPRLLGVEPETRVVVLEDLGDDDRQLGRVLLGDDRARADAGLRALQHALARLHASTRGQMDAFRERYAPPRGCSRHGVHRLVGRLGELPARVDELGVAWDPRADVELRAVRSRLVDPGEWATYTHGDATPANLYLLDDGPRLFDFESGGFRHAMVDGVFGPLRYLHSVWARELPRATRWALLDVYRTSLARDLEAARDDGAFADATAAAATAWLAALLGLLPRAREKDVRWGRATFRQRIVAGLEHFVDVSRTLRRLPRLGALADRTAAACRERWSAEACRIGSYPSLEAES